jgi:hypothetical protein
MEKEKCPNIVLNNEECPCTNMECARRGLCCECVRAHRKSGRLVACMREEALEASKVVAPE